MNIETAKRLLEYRKANGYSQEELAEKIGVSRQAISKWERSESSPDTDNLIALSRLYGITIDELLNGTDKPKRAAQSEYSYDESADEAKDDHEREEEPAAFTETETETNDKWKSFYDRERELIKKSEQLSKSPHFHALLPIVILIIYIVGGIAFPRFWAVGWILFLLIPIIETALTAIRTRNPLRFAYPVLATAIFLFEGMVFYVWHPTWIIFLTIPVYYLVCDAIRRSKQLKEDDLPVSPTYSNGTYYQPAGTSTYYPAAERKHGSTVGKVIISIVCAVTIIATVAIVCTFSWLKTPFESGFLSGIVSIFDTVTSNYGWNYENGAAYTVGNGEIATEGVTQLSVDWLSHNVTVEYYDGDTIAFSEPEQGNPDHQLRWLLIGNELKIQYCKSGLKWQRNNDFNNKDLTVYLPIGFSFNEIEIDTVSGNITLKDITANIVDLETVSGNITASGEYTEISAESVSGNISANGSFTYVDSDTVSGISEITVINKPVKVDFETVSGICRVNVPADISGFTVKYETVSGDVVTNDFQVTRPEKRTLVYGDGSMLVDFDSVSGNLEIK